MHPAYEVTSFWGEFLESWQTLVAGGLAILAAVITVWGTLRAARMQVDAVLNATKEEIAAAQKSATDQITAMRETTKEQVAAILRQNEFLIETEQRKEARERRALATSVLADLQNLRWGVDASMVKGQGGPNVKMGGGTAGANINLLAFNTFRDRVGILGSNIAELFLALESKATDLKSGPRSQTLITAGDYNGLLDDLVVHSDRLISILQTSIADDERILGTKP